MTELETELRRTLSDAANAVTPSDDAWAALQRRSVRPRRQRMRVGLSVAGAMIATAGVLIAIVLGFSDSGSKPAPGAVANVERDLTPTRDLSARGLQDAATILQSRLQAFGVHHSTVVPDQGFLRAYLPTASLGALTAVATTKGVLRFRQALAISTGNPESADVPTQSAVTHSPNLSKKLLRTFATWPCQTSVNPTQGNDAASDYMIACSTDGSTKYLLAPTAVPGHDVRSAFAGLGAVSGNHWVVSVVFNAPGASSWQRVTERAYNTNGGRPATMCAPPEGCNAISITLDGVVQSAPYITQQGGIPGGRTEISGTFTERSATRLAAVLKYGALPSAFAVRKPAAAH